MEKQKALLFKKRAASCNFSSPYLSDQSKSVGISTLVNTLCIHWLPGILGPIPSATLDKGI
ncbi:hypothetical protein SAMN05880501_10650 [Ureibacillus xyleni]|uniref:Uncharacterized protein n=1 Tax=Ureibacillus xyleni TaxID=614648 RepID=A0A285SRK3_9BACL|nr:hypothetical protein SAMN05880501_10650 [Ureibacillus xyleni]